MGDIKFQSKQIEGGNISVQGNWGGAKLLCAIARFECTWFLALHWPSPTCKSWLFRSLVPYSSLIDWKSISKIKSRSTASARLSAYARAHWLQTHKHLGLEMTLIALCCTRQSRAPTIDRCAPGIDFDLLPWPVILTLTLTLKWGNSDVNTQFLSFDLDLWPTTLTYNPGLFHVKVDPHAKNQVPRSNGSARRAQKDRRTLPSLPASLKLWGR